MSRTKANLLLAIGALIVSTVLGILGKSIPTGAFVAIGTGLVIFLVKMLYDIRMTQEHLPADPDRLIANYNKLARGPCELARVVAMSKYKEVNAFFAELLSGRITLHDLNEVYTVLKPLFCTMTSIKEIHATSSGEISEWLETESWWGKNYIDMNAAATKRGVKIKRIFILKDEQDRTSGAKVFQRHAAIRVTIKVAVRQTVSTADFNLASNCLIFYDDHKHPIYCLQAIHGAEGGFVSALLDSDSDRTKPLIEAYGRIEAVAQPISD